MDLFRIPKMKKVEHDFLIKNGVVSRIASLGSEYPYIAPFLYHSDGHHLLQTRRCPWRLNSSATISPPATS